MDDTRLPPEFRCPVGSADRDRGLLDCLHQLRHGPWCFIQLRGVLVDDAAIQRQASSDSDDVDLLSSEQSAWQLVSAAFGWVREGLCHVRLVRHKSSKLQLVLLSVDGTQFIRLDLWLELAQLDQGRQLLTFDHCISHCLTSEVSIRRLPTELEACIYLQHLKCRSKDIASIRVQQRLQQYEQDCASAGCEWMVSVLRVTRNERRVSPQADKATLDRIVRTLHPGHVRRSPRILLHKVRCKLLRAPRQVSVVALTGCDGVGKTSLLEAVAGEQPDVFRVMTGKHLYRKSLVYKAAVIFLRPLISRSREQFEDQLAPILYLRACVSLRLRLLLFGKRLTLLDRSIMDFLFIRRKTDRPRFHRLWRLSDWFGCRIATIHCIVSQDQLRRRKQEVTNRGHELYDAAMQRCLTGRIPTDYLAFGNDQPLPQAVLSLRRVLELIRGT